VTKPQLLEKKQKADFMSASACSWRAFNIERAEDFFSNIRGMPLLGRLPNCNSYDKKMVSTQLQWTFADLG
jgi:hypothetical protein